MAIKNKDQAIKNLIEDLDEYTDNEAELLFTMALNKRPKVKSK